MGHKFLNDPGSAVTEMLEGFVQSHPGVKLLDGFPDVKVVVRSHVDKHKVALVSGGGSGHEPAHAGFVGDGMLDAAVCGDVFASPSVAAVLAAIRHVTGPPGCLLIVKNYTGDRLNFGLAAERAKLEGLNVEMVVVADDCALHDVASKFRQVCALEPFMMENLLGTKVTREKYMLNNDSVCGYVVHAGSCEAADSFQESGD